MYHRVTVFYKYLLQPSQHEQGDSGCQPASLFMTSSQSNAIWCHFCTCKPGNESHLGVCVMHCSYTPLFGAKEESLRACVNQTDDFNNPQQTISTENETVQCKLKCSPKGLLSSEVAQPQICISCYTSSCCNCICGTGGDHSADWLTNKGFAHSSCCLMVQSVRREFL